MKKSDETRYITTFIDGGKAHENESILGDLYVSSIITKLASKILAETMPLDEIAEKVLEAALDVTGSSQGIVSSIDPRTGDNVCHTLTGMMPSCRIADPLKRISFPVGENGSYPGLWGHALNTKEAFYTNNPGGHPASQGVPEGHVEIKNFMAVPAVVHGKVVGEICLANKEGGYRAGELTAIKSLTSIYSISLQRTGMEAEIKEKDRLYSIIAENAADVISVLDLSLSSLYVSPSEKNVTGFSPMETMQIPLEQRVTQDSFQRIQSVLEKELQVEETGVADPHRSVIIEIEALRKEGGTVWVEGRYSFLRDEAGKAEGIICVERDITEKRRMQEDLIKSRERFVLAAKGSRDGIWDWDIRTGDLFISPRWKEMLGYRDDEIPNIISSFTTNVHPDDVDRVNEYIDCYIKGEIEHYSTEFRMRHKNGSYVDILARGAGIRDSKGRIFRMAGSHTDITERKRVERLMVEKSIEINETKQRLEYILGITKTGIDIVDSEYNLQYVDPRRIVDGLDPKGKKCYEYFKRRDLPCENCGIRQSMESGEVVVLEQELPLENNRIVQIHFIPFKNADGEIFFAEMNIDITTQKRNERQLEEINDFLREAKERADRLVVETRSANRAKSDFLANMSHEIRTPMNGILGMIELSQDTENESERDDYLRLARSSAETLMTIINDILDFSKIESNNLEIETIPFDLQRILEETCKILAIEAHQKNIEFICDINDIQSCHVKGDPIRLKQVLSNLIRNAIKFTEKGHVILTANREYAEDGVYTLEFCVEDTGIGMEPSAVDRVFEKFMQADVSTTRKYGGTGLGLPISKMLVEMMGGRIWVDTEPGVGSKFYFKVKLEKAPENNEICSSIEGLKEMRVLIVDDNEINRRILTGMLKKWGMNIVGESDSGDACIALMEDLLRSTNMPDALLVDYRMPGMNGLELVDILAKDFDLESMATMMLTSDDQVSVKRECEKRGIVNCLVKPILPSTLQQAMASQYLVRNEGGKDDEKDVDERNADEGLDKEALGMVVLLAEDNMVNRTLADIVLNRMGVKVTCAIDGTDALEKYSPGEFDAILMDVQMPNMDGLEATQRIREIEKEKKIHTPIIALTAHAMMGDRERFLDAGMDDYMSKPIDAKKLHRMLLGLKKASSESRCDYSLDESGAGACERDILDLDDLRGRLGDDENSLEELLISYSSEARVLMAKAEEAANSASVEELRQVAHSLKGMSSSISAKSVCEYASFLEDAAQGEDIDSSRDVLKRLQRALDTTLGRISQFQAGYKARLVTQGGNPI